MKSYTVLVTKATGRVAYLPTSICAQNAVTYAHHQNDICVTLLAGAAVIL
jgi:hypothetical protein